MASAVTLDAARQIADALLHEGYLLYPYTASAQKNQVRWQFGVLAPPAASTRGGGSDPKFLLIADAHDGSGLFLELRFLRLKTRDEAGHAWDEAEPCVVQLEATLDDVTAYPRRLPFVASRARNGEFRTETIVGVCTVTAEPLPGPYGVTRLSVGIANTTPSRAPIETRADALHRALVATRAVRLGHRSARMGPAGGRRVPERAPVPGAGRARRRRRARIADHPLGPPGARTREPR